MEKPLRPAEYAEYQLLEAIVEQEFKPGSVLPAERVLALTLGVTRPTLREALQRLSTKGWITISQGRQTRVSDYPSEGGLALLGSMALHGKGLSPSMVENLLEVRVAILPGIARIAVEKASRDLLEFLEKGPGHGGDPAVFAQYDWDLQLLMVTLTNNPVFRFIFNDFTSIFHGLGELYFQEERARKSSLAFYEELILIIGKKVKGGDGVEACVRRAMEKSLIIWKSKEKP